MPDVAPPPAPPPGVEPLPLAERIARLEERTAPRPKTWMELLQAYGGILSLAIAMLYSFPLGVWDRWFETEATRSRQELTALRDSLERVAQMQVEGARAASGIREPMLLDTVMRSTNNRILLTLAPREARFLERQNEFAPSEQVMIGLLFAFVEKAPTALAFFRAAQAKDDPLIRLEAQRAEAGLLFRPSAIQDLGRARSVFAALQRPLPPQAGFALHTVQINALRDWALNEFTLGDPSCGRELYHRLEARLIQMEPLMNDNGMFGTQVMSLFVRFIAQPPVPGPGCPAPERAHPG